MTALLLFYLACAAICLVGFAIERGCSDSSRDVSNGDEMTAMIAFVPVVNTYFAIAMIVIVVAMMLPSKDR